MIAMTLILLCLAVVIWLYFANNPLKHGKWFLTRRFINWFPLGMTYAFLYMGRYNLNVSKNALGSLMTKEDFGLIFGIGTAVYALAFFLNGPLVDKFGGKRGILLAAAGASIMNIIMGIITYLFLNGRLDINLTVAFSICYAMNMFFQSFGAVSIIKVKAYWFHVRERGIFGAIFGTLISFGVYFAFDWGGAIVKAVKVGAEPTFLSNLLGMIFAVDNSQLGALWAIFFIPAAFLMVWFILDLILIKDTPEEAGFAAFETADASTDDSDENYTIFHLLKKFFTNPILILIGLVELTSGIIRNGILQWYQIFAKEVSPEASKFFIDNWGLLACFAGIIGSFAAGAISDKFFQSRRGPIAAIFAGIIAVCLTIMVIFIHSSPVIIGMMAVIISAVVIGIHGSMSGTAAADFGGKRNTGTASGIADSFVYLGSSIQSFTIGILSGMDWRYWPLFILPFAVIGCSLCIKMWKSLPKATARYVHEVEKIKEDFEETTLKA